MARVVCYPYPKLYEIGNPNAEKIDWPRASLASSRHDGEGEADGDGGEGDGEAGEKRGPRVRVYKLEITDNARVVTLYHHPVGGWRICSSESSDCSDKICRVRVRKGEHRDDDDDEGGGHHDYLSFQNATHYNPWNFFEEKLIKSRESFAAFSSASKTVSSAPASSSTSSGAPPEEEGEEIDKTFGDFFWEVWKEKGYRLPTDTGLCYSFMLSVRAIQIFNHLTPKGDLQRCLR